MSAWSADGMNVIVLHCDCDWDHEYYEAYIYTMIGTNK